MKGKKVGFIINGVAIDHIPAGKAKEISKVLKLHLLSDFVVIATNLESKKQNKKDLIKIEGKTLSKEELNKIALVCKDATINIIKNEKVDVKYQVEIPMIIENILKCNNPNCISNNEKTKSKFFCKDKKKLKIKCHYCEKNQNTIDIL